MNNFKKIDINSICKAKSNDKTDKDIQKAKFFYNEFVNRMNKSDFCNTLDRYLTELSYVRRLIELYNEKNSPDLVQEMIDRETFIMDKLKNDFGYTVDKR